VLELYLRPPPGTNIPTLLLEPSPTPRATALNANNARRPVCHIDNPGWRSSCRLICHLPLVYHLARLFCLLLDWLETSWILVVKSKLYVW
jgi:hypothetical protein